MQAKSFFFNETRKEGGVYHYTILQQDQALSWSQVIELWLTSSEFCRLFGQVLVASPFAAFRWETSPLNSNTLAKTFSFVLVEAPYLCVAPDRQTFLDYFALPAASEHSIVDFYNLGGDARLVVPSPISGDEDYAHFKAFICHAEEKQQLDLWRHIARVITQEIVEQPLWLSTAGDGVAWLHIRLDKRPKYYHYLPFSIM